MIEGTRWITLVLLLATAFSLFGWLIAPMPQGLQIVHLPMHTPSTNAHVTFRPSSDPIDNEFLQQMTYQEQGRIWLLRESTDPEGSLEITWIQPIANFVPSTPWQRLIREHCIASRFDKALALCGKLSPQDQPIALRVVLESIRYQAIPMAAPESLQNKTMATTESPRSETADERRHRHNSLKREFLKANRRLVGQVWALAQQLPPTDQKAETLEAARQAFSAVDDKPGSDKTLLAMEQLLDSIAEKRTSRIARFTTFMAGTTRVALWSLLAALGTAALAVWQQIASHYSKKAIRAAISDPELAEALGDNLRELGIILPQDFSTEERRIAGRGFESAGTPTLPR